VPLNLSNRDQNSGHLFYNRRLRAAITRFSVRMKHDDRKQQAAVALSMVFVLIGIGCGIKVTAVLIGLGLAWPLLLRREWTRTARMAAAALATVAFEYSFAGLNALKPMIGGTRWVIMPSPWRLFQMGAEALGLHQGTTSIVISCLWPLAMLVVAWVIYQRISSDQPREIVAPFALSFAWVLVAPWVFAWYTALAWATLTLVPRNRMTRWLTIVTVFLALWLSGGGQSAPGH